MVYDQLKEIEKNQTCEKEASNRVKGEQLHLELLGSQLKNNTVEHILLGQVLQAGRVQGVQQLPALPVQGRSGQCVKYGQAYGVGEEFLGKGDSQC